MRVDSILATFWNMTTPN